MTGSKWELNAARWAVAGAFVLLVTDLLLAWVLWNERERTLERGRESVALAAEVALRRADNLFEVLDRTLSGVSEVVAARDHPLTADDLYLHRMLLRRHAITPTLVWLSLLGPDGQLLASSRFHPPPRLALGDRDYASAHIEQWDRGLFIGSPINTRNTGEPVVPVSRRVVNDGGRFIGVIAGGLDTGFVQELVTDTTAQGGMALGIFRSDGHALACLPSRAACPDAPAQVMALIGRDQHTAKATVVEHRLLGEGKGIAAYAASANDLFFVVADLPTRPLLAAWHTNLPIFMVIAFGGNIALTVLGLYAYRQVTRRRQALDALATANRELEDRVRERTRELHRLAHTDVLTGARNRRAFMSEGEALFALAHRHQRELAVLVLDIDRFKSINDRYGHAGGDAVLRAMAQVPDGVLRTSDLFARLGGEEFAIALPETGRDGAIEVGNRLLAAFRDCRVEHEGESLHFTVSIGLSVIAPADTSIEALLHRADAALYRAKEGGRDRLEWAPASARLC